MGRCGRNDSKRKRILITKSVADCHDKLARRQKFERAFVATGTYLPVDHVYGTTSAKQDHEVTLQGLEKDYNYQTVCTAVAIKAKIKEIKEQEESEKKAKEKTLKQKQERDAMSKEHYDQLTLRGSELLKHVMSVLVVEAGPIVSDICETIEAPFVIGGSFAAMD